MHIYFFAPIRYDFLHQRPQKLAEQFRLMSIPLTYVQPTGWRQYLSGMQPGILLAVLQSLWYHLLGILALLLPFLNPRPLSAGMKRRMGGDFEIVSLPLTFPINKVNSPILEAMTSSAYRQFLRRQLPWREKTGTVGIFENPFWGRVIERGDFSRVCYDCMDDLSIYAGHASNERFLKYEGALIDKADVIIATAALLEADLRTKAPERSILRIPNGVDFEWFQTQAAEGVTPYDMQQLTRPIVGYVGSIASWTDCALIREVARKMPAVSFVFVGPVDSPERADELREPLNIHWLGKKPYSDIPSYITRFDVCMIPFKRGSIARTTNPVKLFEYFALGKPVVSTPLDELMPYINDGLVTFGDSAESYVQAVNRCLEDTDENKKSMRIDTARDHSWRLHAQAFVDSIKSPGH
jgi:glycosyltransferase involved in cell wall biosynthesis